MYFYYLLEQDLHEAQKLLDMFFNELGQTVQVRLLIKNLNTLLSFELIFKKIRYEETFLVKNYISFVGSQINLEIRISSTFLEGGLIHNTYTKLYDLYLFVNSNKLRGASIFTPFNIM